MVDESVLVVGASRGIGRATAQALARSGRRIVAHYQSSHDEMASLCDAIADAGGGAVPIAADIASPEGVATLTAQVAELAPEGLAGIVVCAGETVRDDVAQTDMDAFDHLQAVNLRAPLLLLHNLLPHCRDGASIVLIGSLATRADFPGLTAYAALKSGVPVMARAYARLAAPRAVRVNCVAPGVIATDMSREALEAPANKARILGMQALQRIGQPEDIADVIDFLISDRSRWITGATIPVDGGSHL